MLTPLARLFTQGFRVFFLGAGLFAVFSLIVWEGYLAIHAVGGMVTGLPFAPAPHIWHGHEMVFGYTSAAIGGFLLTAVPNWTGTRPAGVAFIATASAIWLAGRVAIWWSGELPPGLVAVADLAFLPLMIGRIALQLAQKPKPQNLAFVLFLSLLWIANLMVHLEWTGLTADTAAQGLRAGLFVICVMIAVLGGRVTPAFTRNALKRDGVAESGWPSSRRAFEVGAVAGAFALALAVLFGLEGDIPGGIAILAGLCGLLRMAGWRTGLTLRQPILWSLHAGMAALGVGLLLWGAAQFGLGSDVAALHVLGIGAVGGMTLAMMSRATLGHTGRPLDAPRGVAWAYGMVVVAAVLRWLGSAWLFEYYMPLVLASGALWIVAFTCYLAALAPAMTGPRLESRP